MVTTVYILSDPASGRVRYVGKTVDIKARLRGHRFTKRNRNHKTNWLRSLGADPVVTVLEEVTGPATDAADVEKRWIARLRADGANLTNATDGGEGLVGFRHSEESRARIGVAGRGRKDSEQTQAKRRARRQSDETRAKIAAAKLGRKRTAEDRAAMRAGWQRRRAAQCS